MQISLNFPERVGLFILVEEAKVGDRKFLSMLNLAKEALRVREDDIKEYGVSNRPDGGINWNFEKAKKVKKYDVPESVMNHVTKRLADLEKSQQLTMELLPIADKILGESKKKR